jgi:hypothetical protein
MNKFHFDTIKTQFPKRTRVEQLGGTASEGTVVGVERSGPNESGRVLVKWDQTGIVSNVHPGYIKRC